MKPRSDCYSKVNQARTEREKGALYAYWRYEFFDMAADVGELEFESSGDNKKPAA